MLPLRLIVNNARWLVPNSRAMSVKASPLVDLAVDNEGIATLTMQRPPVNSLNLDLLQAISNAMDDVERNKYKGMILTSSLPTVFSAGLDIMEMYKPDMKRAEIFWNTVREVWIKLFGSKFPTAAAVNGHAPAGGCLLSISCEHRVMVNGKFIIGLNETALGIVAAKWTMDALCNTISKKESETALTFGKLFSVDEALKIGLIDETATDKTEAVEKCKKFIKKFDRIPPLARAITKQRFREAPMTWFHQNRRQDTDEFLQNLQNPKTQEAIEMYLQKLKQKATK